MGRAYEGKAGSDIRRLIRIPKYGVQLVAARDGKEVVMEGPEVW